MAAILESRPPGGAGAVERRKSPHLLRDVALVVRGESAEHQPFLEETFTISISQHGVLMLLAAHVALGQVLTLINPETRTEVNGRVARFGSNYAGLAQVGIEFAPATPGFWPPELMRSEVLRLRPDGGGDT